MIPVLLTLLYIVYCSTEVQSEAFSSTANLIQLVKTEKEILQNLEAYVQDEENRLQELKRYVDEIRKKKEPRNDDLFYAGHPVNAYNLIKRWYRLSTMSPNTPNHEAISSKLVGLQLPSYDDFIGASAALIRLQRTFDLPINDMARGTIKMDQGATPLQADDFQHIGNIAFKNNDYGLAVQWLEKALASPKGNIPNKDTYTTLSSSYKSMGNFEKAAEHAKKALDLDPTDKNMEIEYNRLRMQVESNERRADDAVTSQALNGSTWQRQLPKWKVNYEKLCRGEVDALANPAFAKDKICRYKQGKIPWVVYKEEILSWDPRIGLFHDVISDKDADMIKEKAYPLLYRANVGDPAKSFVTTERVSKVAWLWDEDSEIQRLSKKVSDITGLTTQYRNPLSSAEPFQVVNYGIGGQYEPHVDFYEERGRLSEVPDYLTGTGDRLCTFLFYLTDVRYGGATVFPRIKLRVPVTKNGAAFWYNAKKSGSFDKKTEHAGCPVLLGQKWVSNKWIREYGQEFRRQCGLTPDTIDYS